MLYQIIVDWKSFVDKSKSLMFILNRCWSKIIIDRWLYTYEIIKLQIIKSSSYKLQSHQIIIYTLYKVIKLQITKSSNYHLYIIQNHQIANYKIIKLLFIHYSIIKLQIIKSSNYHLYIIKSSNCYYLQYLYISRIFCQWLLNIFLFCFVLKNFSIQNFIVKYKQNIYFEIE